jgi:hypothetical protein
MSDSAALIDRLRNPVWEHGGTAAPRLAEQAAIATMNEAADEIAWLRSVAGAVSREPASSEFTYPHQWWVNVGLNERAEG